MRARIPYYPSWCWRCRSRRGPDGACWCAAGEDRAELPSCSSAARCRWPSRPARRRCTRSFRWPRRRGSSRRSGSRGAVVPVPLAQRRLWQLDEFLARFDSKKRNQAKRERASVAQQASTSAPCAPKSSRGAQEWADARLRPAPLDGGQADVGPALAQRAFYDGWSSACPSTWSSSSPSGTTTASWSRARSTSPRRRTSTDDTGAASRNIRSTFNVCLYHSVEECIRRGVQVFEGGAGGEHKMPAASSRRRRSARTCSSTRGSTADPRLHRARSRSSASARSPSGTAIRRSSEGVMSRSEETEARRRRRRDRGRAEAEDQAAAAQAVQGPAAQRRLHHDGVRGGAAHARLSSRRERRRKRSCCTSIRTGSASPAFHLRDRRDQGRDR